MRTAVFSFCDHEFELSQERSRSVQLITMQTTILESHRSVTLDEDSTSGHLYQLCRFCAKKNSCMMPIFRGQGLIEDLPTKIKAYLPIQVSENDTLPLQACSPCVQCLTMWHEFITGCLKADENLRTIYQEMLNAEDDRDSLKTVAEERGNQQIAEGKNSIQQGDNIALSTVELTNENAVEVIQEPGSNDRCSSTAGEMDSTASISFCSRTLEICSGLLSKTENNTSVTPMGHKLKSICHKSTFKCEQCGKALSSHQSLKFHLRIHSGERPYTCQICGIQFATRSGINRHLKEVHEGVKDHVCETCGRAFTNKQNLQNHIRIHTGERPYACKSCKKTFKTYASLYVHNRCHAPDYSHTCPACGKQFSTKTVLARHKLIHTGEKQHNCDICEKRFYLKSDLEKHKFTHKTEKPFVCSHCFCSFKRMKYLKQHTKSQKCKLKHMRASLDSEKHSKTENSQDPGA